MNVLLLAFQASLCLIAQAGLAIPNLEVPVHKPIPIDILNQLPKIVGGQDAIPNEFPFMVKMTIKWPLPGDLMAQSDCGASIINSDFVLTAGHCVNVEELGGMAKPQNIELYFGMTRRGVGSDTSEYEYTQMIKGAMIITKGYKPDDPNHENDIAIIRLAEKIQMGPTVQPICLASGTSDYADRYATVMGWGVNTYGYLPDNGVQSTEPQNLQKTQMYILKPSVCGQLVDSSHTTPGKMCIYDVQSADKGVCSGDSGGPMVVNENGKYVQVGIASYINGPCGTAVPSVYSRVTYFKNFIQQVVGVGTYQTC